MFFSCVWKAGLIWCFVVLASVWILHDSSKDASVSYRRLMAFTDNSKNDQSQQEHKTKQSRERVSKQVFYNADTKRLQSRLSSDSSELSFNQTQTGVEVVENFKGVDCLMQENFFSLQGDQMQTDGNENDLMASNQLVRHFRADKAVYYYQSGRLVVEDAELFRYILPGQSWPYLLDHGVLLLKGRADNVELSFFQKPAFHATGVKAVFSDRPQTW